MPSQRMKDYWTSAATYDRAEEYEPEVKEPCPLCGGEADWCPVCEGVVTQELTAAAALSHEAVQILSLRRRTLASKPPGTCSACTHQEQMGRRCPEPHPPNRVAPCYSGPMAGPERLTTGHGVEPGTVRINIRAPAFIIKDMAEKHAKSVNRAFWDALVSHPLAPADDRPKKDER